VFSQNRAINHREILAVFSWILGANKVDHLGQIDLPASGVGHQESTKPAKKAVVKSSNTLA